ncbi:MAG: CHASE2 domain-containing protein [Bacteroidota bacterium]
MRKIRLFIEGIVVTILVLITTFLLSLTPFKNEYIKPIPQGGGDFDIYDLNYSKNGVKKLAKDTNIVIVEIAGNRREIAAQINLIEKFNPTVIAIDAVFVGRKDSIGDKKLVEVVSQYDNLVFAYDFDFKGDSLSNVNYWDAFMRSRIAGYINFPTEQFSVVRKYYPFVNLNNVEQLSFTSEIAKNFFPNEFKELKNRGNLSEVINYTGNLERYLSFTNEEIKYYAAKNQLSKVVNNKVVLLGYFVKQEPLVLEDLHFTPLNDRISGRSFPDMYGVVVHANVLSMILNGNYVNQVSGISSYLISGVFVFGFLSLILFRHQKNSQIKKGWLIAIQFVLIIILVYIALLLFKFFLIKVYLLPIIISLIISIEMLNVYKSIAIWLGKRTNYSTVFKSTL